MAIQTAAHTAIPGNRRTDAPMVAVGQLAASIGVSLLLVIGALFLVRPAHAAEHECFQRTELVEYLGQRAHEAQSAMGLANNGGLLEVFTTEDQSTWTIFLTMANGVSCVIGAGETWMDLDVQPVAGEIS